VESALGVRASGTFALNIAQPNVLVGLIVGGSVVFLFSSLLIMAVGRAAQRVVLEVRMQFRTHPGIMTYQEKPDYSRVVDIVTADSLRELVTPGLLAVLAPIAIGFTFVYAPLGSYLAGAITVGVLMAIFLANSGGAWDNAKKLVEDGNHGGKGSAAHEATVIGDTVGDPFKDTAGPAINPLIKVMNLVLAADRHLGGEVQLQHRPAGRISGARRGDHHRRGRRHLQAAVAKHGRGGAGQPGQRHCRRDGGRRAGGRKTQPWSRRTEPRASRRTGTSRRVNRPPPRRLTPIPATD